jgi:serine/threonine protein kinase
MSTDTDGNGPQISRYKVLGDLDDIGWGRRYQAEDTLHGRKVHLHLLPADVVMDTAYVQRLRSDVESSAKLSDMNILRVHALERDQVRYVLVTDPIEGESLEDRIRRDGVLPPDEATAIVIQISRGLNYAHRQGCAHGSLQPSKVVMAGGMAKIRDMGLTLPPGSLTAEGADAYAPPEQGPGGLIFDVRADLYALGAIFYRLSTGETPLRKATPEGPTDPRDLKPAVSDGMAVVMRRLMAKRREHRYEDCSALLGDLEAVIDGLEPKVEPIDDSLTVLAPPRIPRQKKTPATGPLPVLTGGATGQDGEDTKMDLPAVTERPDEAVTSRPPRPRKRPLVQKPVIRVPLDELEPPPPPPPKKEDDSDAVNDLIVKPIQASVEQVRRAAPVVAAGSKKAASWAKRTSGQAASWSRKATVQAVRFSKEKPRQAAIIGGAAALVMLILVLLIAGGSDPNEEGKKPEGTETPSMAGQPSTSPAQPDVAKKPDATRPAAGNGNPIEFRLVENPGASSGGTTQPPPVPPSSQPPKVVPPPKVRVDDLTGDAWLKAVKALPPEEQVRRVVARLRKVNPGYDGRETHTVSGGRVTGLFLVGETLKDIAPVGVLESLSHLGIGFTAVENLAPLRRLPLVELVCRGTKIRDLSPIAGMPLQRLDCRNMEVDLRPVGSCPLKSIDCNFRPAQDSVVLRAVSSLEQINGMAAQEFWATADEAAALAKAGGALPEDPAWANAVDLLAMVDIEKDTVTGTWKKQGKSLASDGSNGARIELPYVVPEEYDFRVHFTRRLGSGEVVHVATRNKRAFAWQMGASANTIFGFALTGAKPPERRMAWCLENGRSYTAVVKVRAVGVAVTINGREVARWMNDLSGVGPDPAWRLKHPTVLGLGSRGSPTVFHRAQLLAVKGEGWPLRMPPPALGEGTGLKGEYFVGKYLEGDPAMTRVDGEIDFDWDIDAPDGRVPADSFSVRWTGALLAPHTGRWTFKTIADDGVRLWVGDELLIDDWNRSGRRRESSGTIPLQSGRQYKIRLEFVEYRASATIHLKWSGPGTPLAVIPRRQLYPAP